MKTLSLFNFLILFLQCAYSSNNETIENTPNDSLNHFKTFIINQFHSNCRQDILLTDLEQNTYYIYQAANSIRMGDNYTILGNLDSDIRMKAGEVIVLSPKTVIYRGGHYLARIESCEVSPCEAIASFDLPKGISPNGDNLNDSFDLSDFCVQKITIFNRYGLRVYESVDYQKEWHGQSDKGDLPPATYFYFIELYTGKQLMGWVYLQR